MTARAELPDEDFEHDSSPVPPWVRPLAIEEQRALVQEALDSLARGEGIGEAEADRRIDAMLRR